MTGYGSCTWDFNPISNEFRWVEWNNAAKSCSTDKDCLGDRDSVCGMTNKGIMQCGQLLGYWTLDTFCGYNLDQMYPDAKCRAPMPSPNEGQTLWNLLACVDVPSCYQQHTGTNCCGCTDWQDEFKDVSPSTERCVEQNPNWLEYVKPGLTFMKEACPSAYTYPYDDMSSTFVCSSNIDGGVNNVDYTITYCPQNSGN